MSHVSCPQYGRIALAIILASSPGLTRLAAAACAEQDFVAIVVFDNIYPSFAPQISTLAVTPVGPAVYPTWEQLEGPLMQYFQSGAGLSPYELAGNLWSWVGVYGSEQALVDRRDGAVLFGGTAVWMGEGHILCPLASTHGWGPSSAPPATEPASTAAMMNSNWGVDTPSEADLTAAALSHLRTTDLMHSFAECGDYHVVGLVYTPAIGATILEAAKLIVAIDGKVGAPWNGQAVAAERVDWGALKANYR